MADDTIWHVHIQSQPTRNVVLADSSRGTPADRIPSTLDEQMDAVLEFKNLMKGILDLEPLPLEDPLY